MPELAKYAAYCAWKFGDQVDLWAPLNEPFVVAVERLREPAGRDRGVLSAGRLQLHRRDRGHHERGGGSGGRVRRASSSGTPPTPTATAIDAAVGMVHNMVFFAPQRPSQAVDVTAAAHADYIFNRLWLNATILGDLDANVNGTIDPGEHHPEFVGKADFVGVNYYFRGKTARLRCARSRRCLPLFDFLPITSYANCPSPCSDLGWEIYPEGLRAVLTTAGSYGLPVYVTENGIADADDDPRPAYLVQHLEVLEHAIADGVADVRGYFHWSLIDNFEWALGLARSSASSSTTR